MNTTLYYLFSSKLRIAQASKEIFHPMPLPLQVSSYQQRQRGHGTKIQRMKMESAYLNVAVLGTFLFSNFSGCGKGIGGQVRTGALFETSAGRSKNPAATKALIMSMAAPNARSRRLCPWARIACCQDRRWTCDQKKKWIMGIFLILPGLSFQIHHELGGNTVF